MSHNKIPIQRMLAVPVVTGTLLLSGVTMATSAHAGASLTGGPDTRLVGGTSLNDGPDASLMGGTSLTRPPAQVSGTSLTRPPAQTRTTGGPVTVARYKTVPKTVDPKVMTDRMRRAATEKAAADKAAAERAAASTTKSATSPSTNGVKGNLTRPGDNFIEKIGDHCLVIGDKFYGNKCEFVLR